MEKSWNEEKEWNESNNEENTYCLQQAINNSFVSGWVAHNSCLDDISRCAYDWGYESWTHTENEWMNEWIY